MIHAGGTIAAKRTALGIDLAYQSWAGIGAVILSFTAGDAPAWTRCRTNAVAWPPGIPSANAVADAIDRTARAIGVGAVGIDGP